MVTSAPIQKNDAGCAIVERSRVRAKDARCQLEVLRGALVDSWGDGGDLPRNIHPVLDMGVVRGDLHSDILNNIRIVSAVATIPNIAL